MKTFKPLLLTAVVIPTLYGCGSDSLSKEEITKAVYDQSLKSSNEDRAYEDYKFTDVCLAESTTNTYVVTYSYEVDGETYSHEAATSYDEESGKFSSENEEAYEPSNECLK